jgi:hypothetical protein
MLKNLKQILKNLKSLQLDGLIQSITRKLELYKNYVISGISISLLILSPTLSITWLFFTNIYLIYLNGFNLRDIGKVWIPTFTCWYLIFTQCIGDLVNNYIIIGENHTYELLRLMLINDIWFENLCFQTVYLLHILSAKLNTVIYIPILPIIKLPKTFNADNENSEKKATNSWSSGWWSRESKPTQTQKDFEVCKDLADKLKQTAGRFHKTVKTQDGDRTVVAGETWIPGFGNFSYCSGMPSFAAKHVDPDNKIPSSESSAPK